MPGGRPPTDPTTVVAIRDDGTEITIAARIVQGVRIGGYMEPAARAAGVSKDTLYKWISTGGQARIVHGPDVLDRPDLDGYTRACVEFGDAVDRAAHEWELDKLETLERMERGWPVETVTEVYDGDPDQPGGAKLLKRTVKRSVGMPDVETIKWRLTRRFNERYRAQVEVTGEIGLHLSDEERAENLIGTLEAFLVAQAEAPEAESYGEDQGARVAKPRRKRAARPGVEEPRGK